MSETVAREDALDGAYGGQWSDPLLLQEFADGFRSAREAPIIEMEPFHGNDLFDFGTAEGWIVHRLFLIKLK